MSISRPRPLPAKATTAEMIRRLIDDVAELHDCVHTVGADVSKVDTKLGAVIEDLTQTRIDVAYMKGVQADVSVRLGVKPPAPNEGCERPSSPDAQPIKPAIAIGFMSKWKMGGAALAVFGALSGIVLALRMLFDAAPAIFSAIYHTIMSVSL